MDENQRASYEYKAARDQERYEHEKTHYEYWVTTQNQKPNFFPPRSTSSTKVKNTIRFQDAADKDSELKDNPVRTVEPFAAFRAQGEEVSNDQRASASDVAVPRNNQSVPLDSTKDHTSDYLPYDVAYVAHSPVKAPSGASPLELSLRGNTSDILVSKSNGNGIMEDSESHGTWSGMSSNSGIGGSGENAAERRRRRRLERESVRTTAVTISDEKQVHKTESLVLMYWLNKEHRKTKGKKGKASKDTSKILVEKQIPKRKALDWLTKGYRKTKGKASKETSKALAEIKAEVKPPPTAEEDGNESDGTWSTVSLNSGVEDVMAKRRRRWGLDWNQKAEGAVVLTTDEKPAQKREVTPPHVAEGERNKFDSQKYFGLSRKKSYGDDSRGDYAPTRPPPKSFLSADLGSNADRKSNQNLDKAPPKSQVRSVVATKKPYPPWSVSGSVPTSRPIASSRREASPGIRKSEYTLRDFYPGTGIVEENKPRRISPIPDSFSLKAIGIGPEYGQPGTPRTDTEYPSPVSESYRSRRDSLGYERRADLIASLPRENRPQYSPELNDYGDRTSGRLTPRSGRGIL